MPTYDPIQSYDITATNVSTVTFSSFPNTYTDLVVVLAGPGSGSGWNAWYRLNNNSSSNYRTLRAYGRSNATKGTNTTENASAAQMGESSSVMVNDIWFMNEYNGTSGYKQVFSRAGNDTGYQKLSGGLYAANSSAITTILIDTDFDNVTPYFAVGLNITLYGIKAG